MTEPKFCKDCKHFTPAVGCWGFTLAESCQHPKNMTKPELVHGWIWPRVSPEDLRKPKGNCGKTGAMFEPKPPPAPEPPKPAPGSFTVIEPPPEPQRNWLWSFLGR
jgi:hypothetical protein